MLVDLMKQVLRFEKLNFPKELKLIEYNTI